MHQQPLGLHLSGAVRRAGVLGRPIHHSLSPVLHRAAYAAVGLADWTYEAIDCGESDLPLVLAGSGPEWAGYSVTMPGKRVALAVADRITPRAELVGAANTLVRATDGTWTADNTDVIGIDAALAATSSDSPQRVVVLGAGGTAQAVVVALAGRGTTTIDVLVRDPSRTAHLRATADRAGVALHIGALDSASTLATADVVVSTLPARAADALAGRPWSAMTLVDAVYDPWPTALARAVLAAGGSAVGGDVVLLHQAVAQFELFTAVPAPVDAMASALAQALAARTGAVDNSG